MRGVAPELLIEDAQRPTSLKTRIVAHQQQVVRLDVESAAPLDGTLVETLVRRFEFALKTVDVVVLSDYGKGVLTVELLPDSLARAAGVAGARRIRRRCRRRRGLACACSSSIVWSWACWPA